MGHPNADELAIAEDGQPIDFYFRSFAQPLPVDDIFNLGVGELNFNPHDHLETLLIAAATEGQVNNPEQYSLLLDSDNRLHAPQLPPELGS